MVLLFQKNKNLSKIIYRIFILLFITKQTCNSNNIEKTTELLDVLKTKLTRLLSEVQNLQQGPEKKSEQNTLDSIIPLPFNEKNLQNIAEDDGYGYKYANLTLLKNICTKFNEKKESYTLAVPDFEGIPSHDIQSFLDNQLEFKTKTVGDQWGSIINEMLIPTKDNIIKTKQFPPSFENERAKFEKKVDEAFDTVIKNLPSTFSFKSAFKTGKIDELITQMKTEKLMVRSTGKEDTKELANAGGNESKSNITPENKAILGAMKEVVASYFGHKSLTQRLGAGDPSIFDKKPFTPVLIQRMIGEIKGELPKCGVMFTEEVEGGISKLGLKDKDGKVQTTGISVIQCAYGHNEGVVNSLIPVDTFYVDKAKNIYPVIRAKTHRMAPKNTGGLERIGNEGDLIHEPALRADAVLTLKAFADALENYYGYPMDVEFVINEQEKTIYIVQARPITHSKEKVAPASYLINDDKISSDIKIQGSSIGVAGGAVRFISDVKNIIIKEDIGKALAAYQDDREEVPNTDDIEAIIVGKMAPITSHEATTFRSENKPVLYIPDLQKLKVWIEQKAPLIISPQQSLIIKGDKQSFPLQSGWITYPSPPFVSLSTQFKKELPENFSLINLLNEIVQKPEQILETIKNDLKKPTKETHKSWRTLLKQVKQENPEKAAIALTTLCAMILKILSNNSKIIVLDEDLIKRRKNVVQTILTYANNIKNTLQYSPTDKENYPKRLLPIRFLESILFQQPDNDLIDCYSATTLLLKELRPEQKIIGQHQGLDPMSIQLLKIKSLAMSNDLGTNWEHFVLNIEKSSNKNLKSIFTMLIEALAQLNVLPLWLHTSFAEKYKEIIQNKDIIQKSETAIKDFYHEYKSQEKFFKTLAIKKSLLSAFNSAQFDDPKKFESQWKIFEKDLLSYFINDEFCSIFKQKQKIGKLAALSMMEKFVDIFDNSIKTVTGSTHYSSEEKIKNFRTMLLAYRNLLSKWVTNVKEGTLTYNIKNNKKESYNDYLEKINNVLDPKPEIQKKTSPTYKNPYATKKKTQITQPQKPKVIINHLKRSQTFDLLSCTLGSGQMINYLKKLKGLPNSYEDTFMMIHQSLLAVLNALNVDSGLNTIEIPTFLKDISEKLVNKFNNFKDLKLNPKQSGVELSAKQLMLVFNVPLRDHSLQYRIKYFKNKQEIELSFIFTGGNEVDRWTKLAYKIVGLTKITEENRHIKLNFLELEENHLSFSINFKIDANIDWFLDFVVQFPYESYTDLYPFSYLPDYSFFNTFIKDIKCTQEEPLINLFTCFTILLDIYEKTSTEESKNEIFKELTNTAKIISENQSIDKDALIHYKCLCNVLFTIENIEKAFPKFLKQTKTNSEIINYLRTTIKNLNKFIIPNKESIKESLGDLNEKLLDNLLETNFLRPN